MPYSSDQTAPSSRRVKPLASSSFAMLCTAWKAVGEAAIKSISAVAFSFFILNSFNFYIQIFSVG